jgi:hypothetical protein
MKRRLLSGIALLACLPLSAAAQNKAAERSEIRDFPPDFHQYNRAALPQDLAPGGSPALGATRINLAGFPATLFIRDVIISNTDPNLKNTNHASNSEPSIAVNPVHPQEIEILAFTAGWGANAPVWHSQNGGGIWTEESTIPNPPGLQEVGCPCDQTPDFGQANNLSAVFLDFDNFGIDAFTGTTTDPTQASSWKWLVSGGVAQPTNQTGAGNADQPWLLVNEDPDNHAQDDVYVAYDNFDGAPDMRVAAAPGTDPPNFTIDNLAGFSEGEVNPGQRLAVDRNTGAVYTLFQQCPTSFANCNDLGADPKTINWILNRSLDGGKTWSLNGSATGIQVATGQSTQPTPKFGTVNALLGGVNHVTVDPNNGDVYVVFGNRDPNTLNNRLSIVRLTSDGNGGLTVGTPHFVTGQVQAALPSVAVAKNSTGTIGVLYMVYNGIDQVTGFPMFTAMGAASNNHGATFTQFQLEKFLSPAKDTGDSRQRILGDYLQLKAVGNTFYGVFPGNGVPFGRPFSNIDPIFFKATANP